MPNVFCVLLPSKTEISPRDKEDLELLERALEKAFCVRTGTGHPAKETNKQSAPLKDPRTSAVPSKEGRQTSAAPSSKQTNRMTSKSGRLDRKEQKKTGASVAAFAWTPASRLPEDQMFTCTQRKLNVHMPAYLMIFNVLFFFSDDFTSPCSKAWLPRPTTTPRLWQLLQWEESHKQHDDRKR